MRSVRFSGRARAQLVSIARYYYRQTGDARTGERIVRGIERRLLKLAGPPGALGRPRPELGHGVRSLPHAPYIVLFRYGDDVIDVLQVLHGRQDIRPDDD